ncbi:MAG: hypothetical protein OEZ68_04255 [Gammaproteobacteria bacterium]|nr:hypothetical protein [Gammaproteobacteria bacterium]MDH5800000.1 hypothetical protein [Gammaproteobacteria bacterium]
MPNTAARIHQAWKNTNRLPPYGKHLDPKRREIWVYAGTNAWQAARDNSTRSPLVLPAEENPNSFSWPVRGKEVTVVVAGDTVELDLLRLARQLLIDGATVVRVLEPPPIDDDHPTMNMAVFQDRP